MKKNWNFKNIFLQIFEYKTELEWGVTCLNHLFPNWNKSHSCYEFLNENLIITTTKTLKPPIFILQIF